MESIAWDVHLPGDVAQNSIRLSGAGRVWEIHGLAKVAYAAAAVGNAEGVPEVVLREVETHWVK